MNEQSNSIVLHEERAQKKTGEKQKRAAMRTLHSLKDIN